jgi:hypothetical protein
MDVELQAIPWMDQPALAPVGSVFCVVTPVVAFGGNFGGTLSKIGVLESANDRTADDYGSDPGAGDD